MPDSGVQTVSGEGHFSLGGFQIVTDIYTRVSSLGNRRSFYIGTLSPRRVRFAGGIGTAFLDGITGMAVNMELVTWFKYLNWETEDMATQAGTGFAGGEYIIYRLSPGVELQFVAWYQ